MVNKLFYIVFILLFSSMVFAGGLQASFIGSRFSGMTRHSTVAEYWGTVDSSGNLIDMSGENLLQYRNEFGSWTQTGTCAVTEDQWRDPIYGTVIADRLNNTGGANTDHRYQYTASTSANQHTGSVYVRADIPHNVTVVLNENGVGAVDSRTVLATQVWNRVIVSGNGTGVGVIGLLVYPGENGVATGIAYFADAQVQENDEYRTGPGVFLNPATVTVTKPNHDLAATNGPTAAKADLQGSNGNKLEAREFNGTNQYYSVAHHDSMNVFDGDHTITVLLSEDTGAGGTDTVFAHGSFNTSGIYFFSTGNTDWRARYFDAVGSQDVDYTVTTNDGYYHVLQLVRSSNTATLYYDGDAGTGVDVTGYGLDGNAVFSIGVNSGLSNFFDGNISYLRIDAEALSTDDLAADRERLLGIATNWSQVNAWTFDRSTTAYKTFSNQYEYNYPSHSMGEIAADAPRVSGQGGGVLIEGETTQLHGLTEEFNSWVQNGTCVTTPNIAYAPNGTLTADRMVGADASASVRLATADLWDLTGRKFVYTVWVRVDTPAQFRLGVWETGLGWIGGGTTTYNADTSWQRFVWYGTAVGGGTETLQPYIYTGPGGGWGTIYVWGANLTETTFATSYIPNAGAAATQVTRTADDMTIEPVEAGTNNRILPDIYNAAGPASKLTIYGEFKCEWSSSADIDVNRQLISISGNTGAGATQADGSHNRCNIYVDSTGWISSGLLTSDSIQHLISTGAANSVDFSEWFSVRVAYDLTDFSRNNMWISQPPGNEIIPPAISFLNNTGTGTFYTIDTLIRLGQWYNDLVNGNCHIRNIRIYNDYVSAP